MAVAMGRRIGVTSRMMDWVSKKQPRKSSSRFITSRIRNLLVKMLITALEIMAGMFSLVMNQAKGADMLTTKSTTAELTQLSMKTLYSFLTGSSRKTRQETISA